jgi:hypothetical protein
VAQQQTHRSVGVMKMLPVKLLVLRLKITDGDAWNYFEEKEKREN